MCIIALQEWLWCCTTLWTGVRSPLSQVSKILSMSGTHQIILSIDYEVDTQKLTLHRPLSLAIQSFGSIKAQTGAVMFVLLSFVRVSRSRDMQLFVMHSCFIAALSSLDRHRLTNGTYLEDSKYIKVIVMYRIPQRMGSRSSCVLDVDVWKLIPPILVL